MKKIIFLVMLAAIFLAPCISFAQSPVRMTFDAQDTLNTSSSKDTVTKIIPTTAHYSSFGIQINATKLSGTVSAKAYLYGTLDGTNYVVTDSSAAFADSDNFIWFTKTSTPYRQYKIEVRNATGTNTTQKVLIRTYYTARQ